VVVDVVPEVVVAVVPEVVVVVTYSEKAEQEPMTFWIEPHI
jgi:hypothetical protein